MKRPPIVVGVLAEDEARADARWYEGESHGLGAAFLEVIEQVLSEIAENPRRFPVVFHDVRRGLLKRFPHGIFFRIKPTHVKVIAIMHLARHPSRWQRRR